MKLYKNSLNLITILFVFIFPILPSYGKINSDYILFLLILIQLLGIIIFKEERISFISNIKKFKEDKIILSALTLNMLMYISTIYSVNKNITISNSIRFSLFIVIYYTISYKIKEKSYKMLLLSSFLSVSLISSLVSIYQTFKPLDQNIIVNNNDRIVSFMENSNNLGVYSIFSIFIFILLIVSTKKLYHRMFFLICSILLLINIILSQSRNALLGLILGFILIAFLYSKRFILYSGALCLILFVIPQSHERLIQIFDMTQNSSRIKIWQLTSLMIKDNPLLGTGYESYSTIYPIYLKENPNLLVRPYYTPIHPHNFLLKFQSELGILGTILIIMFIVVTILTLVKEIKISKNSISKSILTAITISFIVFNFMNLLDSYYNILKITLTLFTMLGISKNYFEENESNRLKVNHNSLKEINSNNF